MRSSWAILALGLGVLAVSDRARAAPGAGFGGASPAARASPALDRSGSTAPETRRFGYSPYEAATVAAALAHLGLREDPRPDGKIVEAIDTVRLEVIEERDPAPRFLNALHVVTRPYVIGREALLRPGDRWLQPLADETQRSLAKLEQLSLVLVVAAEGSTPDRVRMVIITKDVWSLRLEWNAALTSSGLEELTVSPSETNFLGTHQLVGLLVHHLPLSTALGGRYVVPRIGESHVAARAQGAAVLGQGGVREGSFGSAQVSLPLWSSRVEWAWGLDGAWDDEVTRLYRFGRLAYFTTVPGATCAADAPSCVPWAYRTSTAEGDAYLTRSFGWARKHDVTVGFSAHRGHFELPDLPGRDPAVVAAFRATRVPARDDRVGPWLQYRTYSNSFLRVLDLDTLALQEDYRLGPQALVRVAPALGALGSTVDLVVLSATASHTAALGDGLASARLDTETFVRTSDGHVPDGSVTASARVASPRTRLGRLVVDASLVERYANRLNGLSYLGGDTRLRGYPSGLLVGANLLVVNVEARTRPVQLLSSLQLGGVLFYDAGDAFDRWHELDLLHAVGLGARVLFPQLDRVVFRADLAFPLSRPAGAGVVPVGFFATFGQAF